MKADIVAVGTELLMGETLDTNSGWLAARLPSLGIELLGTTVVGDDLADLTEALGRALSRSQLVITSGGLGPTFDDLTREAIARLVGEEMAIDPALLAELREWFRGRNMEMPAPNVKQAALIPSATALPNPKGTAPGWWVEREGCIVVALPGPPSELQYMWEHQVVPRLQPRAGGAVVLTRTFKTIGLSEATVDEKVAHLRGDGNPSMGIYAKPDGIHVRLIARAGTQGEARSLLHPVEEDVRRALGTSIWGVDEERPEEMAMSLLAQRGLTLATMESCTGGLLAAAITEVPGSDVSFRGGLIVYAADSLELLAEEINLGKRHGAVSAEGACAMAETARRRLGADIGLGVTGVVGPHDVQGTAAGTVYIGVARPGGTTATEHRFPPRREVLRRRAVTMALLELCRILRPI